MTFNYFIMMTGSLLACIQKLTVQHFTLEVKNLFPKTITSIPVFQLLLVMLLLTMEAISLMVDIRLETKYLREVPTELYITNLRSITESDILVSSTDDK